MCGAYCCNAPAGVSVCVQCRVVWKSGLYCGICGEPGQSQNARWRPPKQTNDKAWKMIEKGDWLWDKRAVVRKESRVAREITNFRERMRARARDRKNHE